MSTREDDLAVAGDTPRLARVATAALLVTPIRIGLGCIVLVAAWLAGAPPAGAVLAFGTALVGTAFVVLQDPRRRLLARRRTPGPIPVEARYLTRLELVRSSLFPSTVGVTALAAISLVIASATLAALLGGVVAGMGLASLASGLDLVRRERRAGRELYAEVDGRRRMFERDRG